MSDNNIADKPSLPEYNPEIEEWYKSLKHEVLDFLKDLVIIVCIVLFIRTFFVLPFQISWQSMYDSYYDKEFIIVDRFSYLELPVFGSLKDPARGTSIVFNTHMEGKEYFIKRIIGLPGETVKIKDGQVFVKAVWEKDFVYLDEKYLDETNYNQTYVRGSKEEKVFEVPENSYFVMWDNRNGSTDSRSCFSSCEFGERTNYIIRDDIVGKVLLDLGYFNIKKFGFVHPDLGIDTTPKFFSSPAVYNYELPQ